MKIGTYRVENTIPFTFVQKKEKHTQASRALVEGLWNLSIERLLTSSGFQARQLHSCQRRYSRIMAFVSHCFSVLLELCVNFFFKMFSIQLAILQLNLFDRPFYQILRRRFSDFFSSSFWAVLAKWTREFTHFDAIPKGWEQRETRIRMRLDSGISWSASEAKQRQETVES